MFQCFECQFKVKVKDVLEGVLWWWIFFFPPTILFSYAKLSVRSRQNLFKFIDDIYRLQMTILIVICSVMF